jgi:predicted small integral membrane protein
VKTLIALANLAFLVWFFYFLAVVSEHVHAWPFN